MQQLIRARPWLAVVLVLVAGAVLGAAAWIGAAAGSAGVGAGRPSPASAPPPATAPEASREADPGEECPAATVEVATADGLAAALAAAAPGDVIGLLPGAYAGNFVARTSGTPERPILLCGTRDAVLDGGDSDDGYVLHLDHAEHWVLHGFSVRNGQKGVMADGTVGSVIRGLTVSGIGDEAIHLRAFSAGNVVRGNAISRTGLRTPEFGEGVYVGTAESNWCDITDCRPDASDGNIIEDNVISGTTAESVDVKEGTTGGIIRGNRYDGSAMVEADSWVDVKGNGWLIEGNVGTHSPGDGFQTHEILDGWGTGNVFRANTARVDGPGFGYALTPELTNVVECGNAASGGDEGFANVPCSHP